MKLLPGLSTCSAERSKTRALGSKFSTFQEYMDFTNMCIHRLSFDILWHPMALSTSRTTQGGGRSFKTRKFTGEVGFCESRMAERSHWWIEKWLISPLFLSLFLSLSLTIYLLTHLSIYVSIYLSLSISLSLSLSLSLYLSIYLAS